MIRAAEEADIPRLVEMAEAMHGESPYAAIPFDPGSMERMVRLLITHEDGILLVTDDVSGMVAGQMLNFYFNADFRLAQEVFWWIEPDRRGYGRILLDAFEKEIETRGAVLVSVAAQETQKPMDKFYQRAGYHPAERHFVKEL